MCTAVPRLVPGACVFHVFRLGPFHHADPHMLCLTGCVQGGPSIFLIFDIHLKHNSAEFRRIQHFPWHNMWDTTYGSLELAVSVGSPFFSESASSGNCDFLLDNLMVSAQQLPERHKSYLIQMLEWLAQLIGHFYK